VAKAMWAKGCSLMLLSPDKKVLLHIVAYGLSDWYVRKGPVSADKSISEALEGKPNQNFRLIFIDFYMLF